MSLSYRKYSLAKGVQKVKTKTGLMLSALTLVIGSGGGLSFALLGSANAAVSTNYSLFGDATIVADGNPGNAAQLVWSSSQAYGGVDFGVPATLSVNGLNYLGTDYKFTDGTCSQGSPRFQINVNGQNVFVYLGTQFPSTNLCAGSTYANSTNVISPTSMVDATQLGNGYETWASFQSQHSSDIVTGIQLVVDGYTTPYITAQFDNTQINDTTYTYEAAVISDKDSCKNSGWKTMSDSNGRKFKNQGDCVSYFATNGKNLASGH
jgi:hypothetical protein